MSNLNKPWYISWFDTPYYHKLYTHRSFSEAEQFMKQLTAFLKLPKQSEILDIPCGRGRHSIFLHKSGYRVTGADLSEQNIKFAKQFETEGLRFFIHDMREPVPGSYDAVFNLFTSFGYFTDAENIRVLKNFKAALKKHGVVVLDFMNFTKVCNELIPEELVERDGLEFHIKRRIKGDFLVKEIDFTDRGEAYHFEEKVRCLDLKAFEIMIQKANLHIENIFGDYSLTDYEAAKSERLIFILR